MRVKSLLLVLVLLTLGTKLSFSQNSKVEFEEYDLKNGLHVILQQDNSTPNIVVSVMYHVGSKNENPELTGFAHFFEHLMFEGTKNIERHQYDKYVSRAGGQLNANTSWDRTYYFEKLPSNQLALGLWLESERMLHARVEAVGIKTQKGVVTQEMKQRVDNRPYGTMLQEITGRAYTKHPYRWRVLGSEEHVNGAKDKDFMDFYKKFYVPNNAVLTICGDFKIEDAKGFVSDYFAEIPQGASLDKLSIVEPEQKKEIRDTIYDNVQLPAMFTAYHGPAEGTKDFYAVNMLATLLTDGNSSILRKTLKDEKKLALEVSISPFPMEDPGLILSVAIPNMGIDIMDLEKEIDVEINKIKERKISNKELQKLRNMIENSLVSANSSIERRAENLAKAYTFHSNTGLINKQLEKYFAVTPEDIMNVAKKYFRPENRVVLYYLPKKK